MPLWLLALLLLPAAAAQAGGLPPTALDAGPEGVLTSDGAHRFTATPLATRTVLTQSEPKGGRVLRASVLEGRWGVPVVAYDRTSGGLSADAETLVLTRVPRFHPRRATVFAVVDTDRMAVRHTIRLPGEWRVDALSPHGRRLHLVEQHDPFDPAGHTLRVYDLARHRLTKSRSRLSGHPLTRTTSPSGRRHYTLYAAGAEPPVVHVLDTLTGTSRTLALPDRLARHRRLWGLRLRVGRNSVAVVHGDDIVASAARRSRRASAGGGPPWLLPALGLSGLLLAAGGARRRRAQAAASRRRRELR